MARIKRGLARHKRHRKITRQAEGYWGRKKNVFKRAKEQLMKAGQYAFRDRRAKKREFRKLWIVRINAAARNYGMSYNAFIRGLKAAQVEIDRKVLADLAVRDADAFARLAEVAKQAHVAA